MARSPEKPGVRNVNIQIFQAALDASEVGNPARSPAKILELNHVHSPFKETGKV